jgi:hypothetical protein
MPAFAKGLGISDAFAQFFGGTSILIMVGVILDTLQQVETHLLNQHYDGLMQSGRIQGRTGGVESEKSRCFNNLINFFYHSISNVILRCLFFFIYFHSLL